MGAFHECMRVLLLLQLERGALLMICNTEQRSHAALLHCVAPAGCCAISVEWQRNSTISSNSSVKRSSLRQVVAT
jgi:hypothetical protein